MKDQWTKVVIASALMAAALGCAARGPAFTPVAEIPPEKALVYIYRPSKALGSGVSYAVRTGDEEIIDLGAGGYFPYLAEPGEREFWAKTEARASVTEHLQAGKTYYLKGGIGMGFFVGHPKLAFVGGDAGAREVAECRLLSK